MLLSKSVSARFHRSYLVDPETGCWNWMKSLHTSGYGQIGIGRQENGNHSMGLAHRVSWTLANGPIPEGLYVLHKCDNQTCVNPAHLFVGTQLDNIRDMDGKARRKTRVNPNHGEEHQCAKLSMTDVLAILADNRAQTAIAADFGVSQSNISKIKRGVGWRKPLADVSL